MDNLAIFWFLIFFVLKGLEIVWTVKNKIIWAKLSFALPDFMWLNNDFFSELSFDFFPILTDGNSIVGKNVIHAW